MVDVQALLDPEIAKLLEQLPMGAFGKLKLEDIPAMRQQRAAMAVTLPLSDKVERRDHTVPGDPPVTVRVHTPLGAPAGPLPCVYWMHGGGYMFGTYEMDDLRFDGWCTRFGCVGVSVEYRLAPECPYPGPLEDCYAGVRWVYENADELRVDRGRLGIAGASAGGGLCAGLALLARDRGEIPLAFQMLIYPMIDDRQVTPSSSWEVPIWPPAANTLGWRAYLGALHGGDVPVYAAAARATDLAGLPPAYVMVGALDGFADEDVDYATRLNQAGVATELHVYPGAIHGFDSIAANVKVAHRARQHMQEWLGTVLRGAPEVVASGD